MNAAQLSPRAGAQFGNRQVVTAGSIMVSEALVWFAVVASLPGTPAGGQVREKVAASDSAPAGQPVRSQTSRSSPSGGGASAESTNIVSLSSTPSEEVGASPASNLPIATKFMEEPGAAATQAHVVPVRDSVLKTPTTVALRWENDVIGGTDEGYSNGVSLTVSREGPGPLGWIWNRVGARERRRVTNYELSQFLFTPSDLSREVPDPTDVPYSGILVGSVSTHLAADDRLYGLKLVAGVRGPAALGEPVQKLVHRLTGSRRPRGWSHQLPNHLLLNVTYEQRRRFDVLRSDEGWEIQAIPRVAGSVGNALIEGQMDAQILVGFHLPDDFGVTETRGMGSLPFPRQHAVASEPAHGVYAFLGGGGHAVSRNIALDAKSLGESAQLDKCPAVASVQAGVVYWTRRFELAFVYVVRGREYDTQSHPSRFGSASLAFGF